MYPSLMVLISGPYRSGTGGDPELRESRGADQDVVIALNRGIPVYYSLDEIPGVVLTGTNVIQ